MLDIKNMRKVVLINVYIPPQGSYKTACKQLLDAIKGADLKENANICLLGDFNINLKDKKYLVSATETWGLKQLISQDTRLGITEGNLKGSCIDTLYD